MHGIEPITAGVQGNGMPSFLAYGVYLGEVLGPILVIIGLFTRLGALMVVVNMIVAIVIAASQRNWATLDPNERRLGGRVAAPFSCWVRWRSCAWGRGVSVSTAPGDRAAATPQATSETPAM